MGFAWKQLESKAIFLLQCVQAQDGVQVVEVPVLSRVSIAFTFICLTLSWEVTLGNDKWFPWTIDVPDGLVLLNTPVLTVPDT